METLWSLPKKKRMKKRMGKMAVGLAALQQAVRPPFSLNRPLTSSDPNRDLWKTRLLLWFHAPWSRGDVLQIEGLKVFCSGFLSLRLVNLCSAHQNYMVSVITMAVPQRYYLLIQHSINDNFLPTPKR